METPEAISRLLDKAHDSQSVLTAGWEAFDCIRQIAHARAHETPDSYATWMSVIPPACEGRNALGPSPSADQDRQAAPEDFATDDQAAHDVVALAEVLTRRLRETAGIDPQTVERAVLAATEIIGLLADGD
jgi:hypothetical protein